MQSPWILVFSAVAISVGAYLQALHFPFVSDDTAYITHNSKLAGLAFHDLWRLFDEPYNYFSEFLPLRDLSLWFDLTLFGPDPVAFRLHNIVLYLLSMPLIHATTLELWRYFRPSEPSDAQWAAAVVTALFALHPCLVESVVWASGRKYILPNLFAMLSLWLAMRTRSTHGLSLPHAGLTLAAFAAMMLSKTSYVSVAPVIALLWLLFWFDVKAGNRRYTQLAWPVGILLLAGKMTLVFIASSTGTEPAYVGIEAVQRVLAVQGWLTRLSLSPENRHFYYPVFEDASFPVMVTLGAVTLSAIALMTLLFMRRRSLEGFAAIVFILLCFPYMQLIPYSAPSLVSDRFLSLAEWPAMILVVSLAWRLKFAARAVLLLVLALSFGYQTINRTADWRSEDRLWNVDMQSFPGYFMPVYAWITIQSLGTQESYDSVLKIAHRIDDAYARDVIVGLINADRLAFSSDPSGSPAEAVAQLQNVSALLQHPPERIKWNSPMHNFWKDSGTKLGNLWQYLGNKYPDRDLTSYQPDK